MPKTETKPTMHATPEMDRPEPERAMGKFRTVQEMDKIYDQREEQSIGDQPYVLEYKNGDQTLIFFGSSHSADPENPQMAEIESRWQQFMGSPNPNKQAFSEGMVRDVRGKTKEQSITENAEPGLVCWLAQRYGIALESPEPDRTEEIDYLHETAGFSYEQIINYYFSRQMLQWIDYDFQNNPDWRNYTQSMLAKLATIHDWGNLSLDLGNILKIYGKITGKNFSEKDKEQLYKQSNPIDNPVSNASGRFRDQKIFEAVKRKWQEGFDVFVVYGSGHAIILEPALYELTTGKNQV